MCLLGVGFLQQGAPELVVGGRVKHDKLVSHRGQAIVHNNVQPLVVLPKLQRKTEELGTCSPQSSKYASNTHHLKSLLRHQCYLEMKDARISVVKLLVRGDDVGERVLLEGQGCNCCQKPAVT